MLPVGDIFFIISTVALTVARGGGPTAPLAPAWGACGGVGVDGGEEAAAALEADSSDEDEDENSRASGCRPNKAGLCSNLRRADARAMPRARNRERVDEFGAGLHS